MVAQLRAVEAYEPTLVETHAGLSAIRHRLAVENPEAETINFQFGEDYRLIVTFKATKREARDAILFRLRAQTIQPYRFKDIIEGVETGARRRLLIRAEIV